MTPGHHLTKEQLDNGIRSDQELYTDFGNAYNNGSIEHYGVLADDVRVSIGTNPAKFHPIDASNHGKTKAFVRELLKEYEKTLIHWRVSGTHGSYGDSLPTIKPKGSPVMMVYTHHHMCRNSSLLEQCAGLLDSDAAFETVPGGGLNALGGRRMILQEDNQTLRLEVGAAAVARRRGQGSRTPTSVKKQTLGMNSLVPSHSMPA